jgi:hypothetical protein
MLAKDRPSTVRLRQDANAPRVCALPTRAYTHSGMPLSCSANSRKASAPLIYAATLRGCLAPIRTKSQRARLLPNCAACDCTVLWSASHTAFAIASPILASAPLCSSRAFTIDYCVLNWQRSFQVLAPLKGAFDKIDARVNEWVKPAQLAA